MNPYPAVDPIPLPAPVWLLKLLHVVTLSLHFVAVEMLLGGLLLAVLLSLFRSSPLSLVTARAIARRLTVVMTFVINLAVPPLLFAQVLYGRALYTSSVLIGLYWISIIGILMLTYWLLYRFTARLEAGKSAWWVGLSAWALAGCIARLLSSNMTLMLRPEVWRDMYSASAMGAYLPTGDPTLTPRWLLMMTGGLFIGGLWLVYLAGRSTFTAEEKSFAAGLGGKVAAAFGVVYLLAGLWAASVQPEIVKAGLAGHSGYPLYKLAGFAGYGWLALVVIAILVGAIAGFAKLSAKWIGWASWIGVALAVLLEIMFTVYRDGVRDLTLLSKNYDVWNRVVVTNWSVVGLFLVLFVAGLGVIGWLVSVVARAQKPMEGAAYFMSELANSVTTVEERLEPGERNTRRAFLAAAGAAGLCYTAALAYPIYRYLASPEEMALSATAVTEVTLKDAQKLPAGSVLMFKFGTAPAMLIHHEDGRWIAMTAVCTHLGCTVQYEPQADRIHCACHGGVYNPYTGANVSGPPPKPLKLFKVAVNDAGVEVSRA